MKLFILSKEDVRLAREEAQQLHDSEGKLVENLLFLDVDWKPGLAFTRSIHEVLFEASEEEMDERSAAFPWHEQVKSPFAIQGNGLVAEKAYAGHVWRSLEENGQQPAVDLQKPQTTIAVFKAEERVIVTLTLWTNEDKFSERRPHLRPRNHPTGLSPKLARAMINLAGSGENLLDPFCGAGGILLEGALVNRAMTGTDIDEEQVKRAEENLAHFTVAATLTVGDATKCDSLGRFDAIVTDLPFGKNSKLDDAKGTFTAFFAAATNVTDTVVVAIDTSFNLEACFNKEWTIVNSFDWYLHKTLGKKLYLLRKH